jgi:hypothetical protein
MKKYLVIILLLCSLNWTRSCTRSQQVPVVTFVVPAGYVGWIVVKEKTSPPESTIAQVNHEIIVDSGGMGEIQAGILSKWHTMQARRSDGKILPVLGYNESADDQVILRDGPTRSAQSRPTIWTFFVGTKSEMERRLDQLPNP